MRRKRECDVLPVKPGQNDVNKRGREREREREKKKGTRKDVTTENPPVRNLVRKEYRQSRKRRGLETSSDASRKDLFI